jgi:hypothetical protein
MSDKEDMQLLVDMKFKALEDFIATEVSDGKCIAQALEALRESYRWVCKAIKK